RRRHTRSKRDWSSDVCSSDLYQVSVRNLPARTDLRYYRLALTSWPLVTEKTLREDLSNLGVTAKVGKDNHRSLATSLKREAKIKIGRASCRERVKGEECGETV